MVLNSKLIALTAALLAVVFLAHAAGRFTQVGGAQFAPSIAIYTLMAYLLANQTKWSEKIGIGFLVGVLTMLATSSPFPPAAVIAHMGGFLVACVLALAVLKRVKEISIVQNTIIGFITTTISWALFAVTTWVGLTGTPFTGRAWSGLMNINFGAGFVAWFLYGFVSVGIPTVIIVWILTPILYRAVRPALVRQGMLAA
jgi:hypothetical protein